MKPGALRIALIYMTIALLWIVVTDSLLYILQKHIDPNTYDLVNSGKGFVFVFITGYLLFKLIHTDEQKLIENTRKAIESRKEAKRLGNILDEINSIVVITDKNNHISWANKAFESTTGYTFQEVAGYSLATFFIDGETGIDVLSDILASKQAQKSFSVEVKCRNKSGQKFWVLGEYAPIFDDSGNFNGYTGVYNNITSLRKQMDDIALENSKLRGAAWLSSHEVRRHLVNIIGMSTLIKETTSVDEKLRILETINQSTKELDKIVSVLSNSAGYEPELVAQPVK